MDAAGAAALGRRIEQQRHWLLAQAVRDGRQPRIDPDSHALLAFRGSERVYADEDGSFVKHLTGGAWSRRDDDG